MAVPATAVLLRFAWLAPAVLRPRLGGPPPATLSCCQPFRAEITGQGAHLAMSQAVFLPPLHMSLSCISQAMPMVATLCQQNCSVWLSKLWRPLSQRLA